jgi:hypothetical protein
VGEGGGLARHAAQAEARLGVEIADFNRPSSKLKLSDAVYWR